MVDISARHQALIDYLKQQGFIRTPRIEAAFHSVLRHLFLPNVPIEKVYTDEAIITKQLNGVPISSSSQPAIVAIMLEQLSIEEGDRVLEIGAGTGYNAALIDYLVGDRGQVTTIDIDADIVENARQHLLTAGCDRVQVICCDGGFGYPAAAPYDRIILTVGAWDIIPAWQQQLKPNGRLVLPLTITKNVELTVAFDKVNGFWESVSAANCGFMKLRGAFNEPQKQETNSKAFDFKEILIQVNTIYPLLEPLPLNLTLKLYNLVNFGCVSLKNLKIKAYPQEMEYAPAEKETVIDKTWTKFVLSWQ
jgi:protein-L-isoaspartate(D-aspartate) O-methyltransferase